MPSWCPDKSLRRQRFSRGQTHQPRSGKIPLRFLSKWYFVAYGMMDADGRSARSGSGARRQQTTGARQGRNFVSAVARTKAMTSTLEPRASFSF
ncbi:MAG: hypothetical protein A3D56_04135 [Candidatus Taylorbacteria bacterium RIFCSPHIGHO2_02_FULL_45_35]|uniref:Uncharacterized protein n=1 Tax=Candidatus Taylorbacteria bacterium RIFCSPHIGHO2_02_FULL_45_35 TaxID=1802311 RepID=A0A1G2MRD9_9BACT|nr:MAG: hypothetical protein A3D56_04135 [Candidatus Taylorbacteria bacterium RIFCSPHIGHO2_02_FULL_45_35]OHA32919.1 MAG: hypothetical protein A3A22_01370 [Candidatus Taylorbacteria bacterium RIFCSPLOWO2_01_FULL_45_34b]